MKKKLTKIISLILAVLMVVSLVACNNASNEPADTTNDTNDTVSYDKDLEIKISVLSGTTAIGMTKMIVDSKNGTNEMNYNIELVTDPTLIVPKITKGTDANIAALPTNLAAKLYKQSEGKVQILAINTLGVLYLLQTGETPITDFNDLKGKTVYLPGAGSNPEYITAALFEANGLEVGKDVILDTTSYPSPDALQSALTKGTESIEFAVLPEPKVTVTMLQNSNLKVAMDFTEKWEAVFGENTLAQGCLVVNADFAKAHPAEIKKFLEDYKASVDFVLAGDDSAISAIVEAGILPKEAIAKKALPNCNICYIVGNEMKEAISVFYEKLFEADNSSIGSIPDDGFYYVQ